MITNISHDTLEYQRKINDFYPEMIFSREDTIELRQRNVREKHRNDLYTFLYEKPLRASYHISYPYNPSIAAMGSFEKILLNTKTGLPLHGIYKIIQNKRKYSLGYYFYGRPYLPWLGEDSIQGRIDYYVDDTLQAYSLFTMEQGLFIEQILTKKENVFIYHYKCWDIGV